MSWAQPDKPLRLLVMATGPFAVPMIEHLSRGPDRVVELWTRMPPTGLSPAAEAGEAQGLPVRPVRDANVPEAVERLRALAVDLLVVCDFGTILKPHVLEAARLGGINLHGSLLPQYRGAAPVAWALYHGETETGVTVIHLTPKLDAGPILCQRAVAIEPDDTTPTLEARLAACGAPLVAEAVEVLRSWDGRSPIGRPQSEAEATRAPRLRKQDGWIDWGRPAEALTRQVRAFQPWPGSTTWWVRSRGRVCPLKIWRASAVPCPEPAEPGTVVVARERIVVAAGEGALQIEELQPAGKRTMSALAFLRGYPLAPGTRLLGAPPGRPESPRSGCATPER